MVLALHTMFGWVAAVGLMATTVAQASEQLVAGLERQGFFRYTTAENADSTKTAIIKDGWKGLYSIQGRLVVADSEDLGEGGVCGFLRDVAFLATQRTAIKVCIDDYAQSGGDVDSYHVVIGGQRHLIWDGSDLARERRESGWLWGIAAKRVTDLINARLKKAGSEERAYGLYGGNDFHIFFLTPTLMTTIADVAKGSPQEIPYVVTDEYPWFGAKSGSEAP